MIPLFAALPDEREEEKTGALSDEFEGAAPSNQYWTKKDAKYMLLGIVILGIIAIPLFFKMRADKWRYVCGQNFKAISTSMNGYAADNDERLPPAYVPQTDTPYPRVNAGGRPYTWASTLVNLSGFDTAKHSFACPAADSSEITTVEGLGGADMPMTYGMYAPYSTAEKGKAATEGRTVLIAETANNGASNTYDPHPMPANSGSVQDGFLIGWSTGDFAIPADNKVPPPSVTRVAVENSKSGLTRDLYSGGKVPQSRHDDKIFVLFLDGHYSLVKVGYLLNSDAWAIPSR